MFQGTGSDVGKSLIVAGLCRFYARQGKRVRPFKPQNMSNNAAVTAEGGEIGRAQALQARACGLASSVHMNPVLLKPQSEIGAQVVVQGRVWGQAKARDYRALRPQLLPAVLDSFARLSEEADLVLVEGAGSPAEVNLRDGDIANMGFAEAADVPVLLVGDIDRGGVIASIVGTMALLPKAEAARIKGYLINKFRGDPLLFEDGLVTIDRATGLKSVGVVPWFSQAHLLPAEDAVALNGYRAKSEGEIKIAVPRLPRISNFDDLDPLRAEPDVRLELIEPGHPLPADVDLVLLPGSKSTIGDLQALRDAGWDIDIKAHVRRGGRVLGLCGGYQMLGVRLDDPDGTEGPAGAIDGLGMLQVETRLGGDKALVEVAGQDRASGQSVRGYEMHIGQTRGADCARPMLDLQGRPDGAISADGRIMGTYVHGIFASDGFRHAFLNSLRARAASGVAYESLVDQVLDELADHLARHLDTERILDLASRTAR
ncbi:cobyric acid synthase [Dongia deserti]|uniref:cobyric acid synthase n=1 Tax=Dongia deserti TaxID=2268030 RepID=UPI000E65AA82|nr:cobyric acid synthase [Dongia deserti]